MSDERVTKDDILREKLQRDYEMGILSGQEDFDDGEEEDDE